MSTPQSDPSTAAHRPGGLRPQWRAFLSLGFRPLYLLGCSWAVIAVALWVFRPGWLAGELGGLAWHAHEMLWGFVATIAVGFLLTAGANWTGINPLAGRPLAAICLVWLIARLAFLVPGAAAFSIGVVAELIFFGAAAVALGRAIHRARNRRNYGLPLMVAALGVSDLLFLLAVQRGDPACLLVHSRVGLTCMAVIALLIARRVIPFFSMRAVSGLALPMLTRSGQYQVAAAVLALPCLLLGWQAGVAATLAVAGGLAFWQLVAWQPLAVRRVPLLWILYLGYAGLGAGLLMAALQAAQTALGVQDVLRSSWSVHLIGVAGFAVLILGMVTRTALGHLGRALKTDRLMVASFVWLLVAAALRLLALLPLAHQPGILHGAAAAWILAFGLYLWRFVPLLIRPRADQPEVGPVIRA